MTEGARSSNQDTSLLDELLKIDFSPAEKDRLGRALADSESDQARMLESSPRMIRDPEFWGWAQKKFKVNGFRPGIPDAMRKVVQRAQAAARAHCSGTFDANWSSIWPLYRRAAHAYLQHDRPSLTELLEHERVGIDGPGSQTEQILRTVVKCLPLYDVPIEHVRELYELWGLERTEHIEDILSDVSLRADAVHRMIDNSVSALEKAIQKELATEREQHQRLWREHSQDLASVRVELTEMRRYMEQALSNKRSSSLRTRASDISSSPLASTTTDGTRALTHQQASPEADRVSLEPLVARIESLGKQLKALRSRLDEEPRNSDSDNRSSSNVSPREGSMPTQVMERWQAALVATGAPNSLNLAQIVLEVLRRSRVFLTREPRLLTELFTSVPDGQTRVIAASPLWLSDADWREGLAFLEQEGKPPRLLVIENFDSGLQEAYLLPSLLAWLASVPTTSPTRIALVPSGNALEDVSPRVLEVTTCLAYQGTALDWTHFGDPTTESLQKPAQLRGELLQFERSMDASAEHAFAKYLQNQHISVPSRLLRGFANLVEGLRSRLSLSLREACVIAQEATLIPWAQRAAGEAHVMIIRNALRSLYEP